MSTRHALFFGTLAAAVASATTVRAQGEDLLVAPSPFDRECGVGSQDLFLQDLMVNSGDPYGYCLVDNPDWPDGIVSTLGLYVGVDENSTGASLEFAREEALGPLTLEANAGVFHYQGTGTTWTAGGSITFSLGPFEAGISHQRYIGENDYEDTTDAVFVRTEFGPIDLEAGLSRLDSGYEGTYIDLGYTHAFRESEVRVSVGWFCREAEVGGVQLNEEYVAAKAAWRF